jgi:hypothetical protein
MGDVGSGFDMGKPREQGTGNREQRKMGNDSQRAASGIFSVVLAPLYVWQIVGISGLSMADVVFLLAPGA